MQDDFEDLKEVREIFQLFPLPWFFCGGWAIDLYIGNKTREHSDIEAGIFREDQTALQQNFNGWKLHWLRIGETHEWLKDVYLNQPVHEILAETGSLKIEILLNDKNNTDWVYRRNAKITLPLTDLILTKGNIPFLCPEVVLLYKSKDIRPKDQQDFELCLPRLISRQKTWLKESLMRVYATHRWIGYL